MTGASCLFLLLTCCAGASPTPLTQNAVVESVPTVELGRSYRSGSWQVQESENFHVCIQSNKMQASEIARVCEVVLAQTKTARFSDDTEPLRWRPRCQIVIHPNKTSYLAAVGAGGAATVGSAIVERREGRVISRRIDLCATTRGGALSALPHEMTHVVLSDRFPNADPPRWADEGLAVLADPPLKQARHAKELETAIRDRALFRLPELMSDAGQASVQRPGVFYAQSTSLVEFLVARGTRIQFLDFLTVASEAGYDRALRKVYEIDGMATLEALWHRNITSPAAMPTVDSLVEDKLEVTSRLNRS